MKSFTLAHYDFKMRTRRKSFIMLCAFLLLAAYCFVPHKEGISIEVVSGYRPLSDPTWIPMSAAVAAALFLPLIGFLYVKNVMDTDRNTGVINLVNASAIDKLTYMLGKFLSNVFLLLCFLLIIMAGALLMMAVHFPGQYCSLYAFITPFLAVIPGLFFVSALSSLFEAPSSNKCWRSWSNVIYVGVWTTLLTLGLSIPNMSSSFIAKFIFRAFEFTGYEWQIDSIGKQIGTNGFSSGVAFIRPDPNLPPLAFQGLSLNPEYVVGKLLLIAFSFLIVILSAILLPRHERVLKYHKSKVKHISKQHKLVKSNCDETLGLRPVWTPVGAVKQRAGRLILAELNLLLKRQSILWIILIFITWIMSFTMPLTFTQDILFPILYGLSFQLFGELGCRIHRSGIFHLFCTIDGAPVKQFFSEWMASIIVSIVLVIPIILRIITTGSFICVFACVAFALFVPALAIFLGEYTKTERVFEVLFLFLIYMLLNSNKIYGISVSTVSLNKAILLLILTAGSLIFVLIKRISYRDIE